MSLCQFCRKFRYFRGTTINQLNQGVLHDLKSVKKVIASHLAFVTAGVSEPFKRHQLGTNYCIALSELFNPGV